MIGKSCGMRARVARVRYTKNVKSWLAVVVLHGSVLVNGTEIVREGQLVQFGNEGAAVEIEADNAVILLVLSGEPINEPVVGHGPFVMNSKTEVVQAFEDFNSGRFGLIPA